MWQISKGRLDRLYVFINGADNEKTVPVGVLTFEGTGRARTSRFAYGRSWLDSPARYGISPTLPPTRKSIPANPYEVPLPLYDAAPDGWGRSILEAAFPSQVFGLGEFLAAAGDERVGMLRFGPSVEEGPQRWIPASEQLLEIPTEADDMEALVAAAEAVDAGQAKPHHLALLFRSSTDQGGARPKAGIVRNGERWIAKFRTQSDAWDDPRIEAVCLSLAKRCGIDVPEHQVISIGGRSTLLVRRFDRAAGGVRHGYVSAGTIAGAKPTSYYDADVTYAEIAAQARALGIKPCEREIFRRVLFNAFVHNTDDHVRNHGFLRTDGKWRLSPAFDITVHRAGRHVLLAASGVSPAPDPRLAFMAHSSFRLSLSEAKAIYDEMVEGVRELPDLLNRHEVTQRDREVLSEYWKHLLRPPAL